jgi:hypothetical protein
MPKKDVKKKDEAEEKKPDDDDPENTEEQEEEKTETKTKKEEKPKPKPMDEEEMKTIKLVMEGKKAIWQGIVDKLIGLRNDVALNITKNGIFIRLTDEGNVALAEHDIKKGAFDEYSVSHEIKIGVDLTKLQKHLKVFGDGDLTVTNDLSKLVFKGEKGKVSRMGLLDSSLYPDVQIPEMTFDVSTKTPFESISKMVKVGGDFDVGALKFCAKDSKFVILMEGDTDDVRFPICAINNLTGKKNFGSFYSRDYLDLFDFKDSDEVNVKFSKDAPLLLEHDDAKEHTVYMLAPRIESDDDKGSED